MPRIIVLDDLSQDGLDLLQSAGNIEVVVRTGLKGEELRKALLEADGAICRSGVKITAEVLAGNQRLRAIARAGVGVDNIDTTAATRQGIVVMNTPGGNTISTAEHALALMLGLSRNLAAANQSLVEKRWDRKKFMGSQLAGKTLGIIGLGRIGHAVAVRALALEMRVIAYDPFLTPARAKELGIQTVNAARDMLPLVDYLTVHTPLNDETRNLIGAKEVAMLKKGARLINCARGGIYDEQALADGLRSGQIGGVALDVYATEPCTDSPLFGMPNVLCTPHLGASTEEAQTSVAIEAAELLIDYFTTGAIKQSVNMSPLDPKTLAGLRDYLNVAYRLGLLLAQVDHCPPTTCRLSYKGEVAKKDTRLLSAAFAAGLLQQAMAQGVNIVNSAVLLRERGIELVEQRTVEIGDFSSMITAEVISEERTSTRLRHALRQQHAPARAERRLPLGKLPGRHADDFRASGYAGRDRPGGQHLRRPSDQHRADVRRSPQQPARRRGRGGAGLGLRAAGRGPGRDRRPALRHPGVRGQVATCGRNAPMAGRVSSGRYLRQTRYAPAISPKIRTNLITCCS